MKATDKALGMNQPICRRDFLNATLLASGSLLMKSLSPLELMAQEGGLEGGRDGGKKTGGLSESDWNGPNTGIGDYEHSNGNTWEVVNAGHDIRFGVYDKGAPDVADSGEVFDCVIVGGGIAGLSAAWTFKKKAGANRSCLILENHPMFGGEAKGNEMMVDGHRIMGPQGSNLIWAPDAGSPLGDFLLDINCDWRQAEYVPWGGPSPAMELSRTSYSWIYIMPPTFGFYFGQGFGKPTGSWVIDPWGKHLEGVPFSPQIRQDMLKWWNARGNEERLGKRAQASDSDPRAPYLDTITQEQRLMEDYGVSQEMVRQFLSPLAATGYGIGCDALSGFAAPSFYRLLQDKNQFSFPGGNAGIARHAAKALIPDALPGPVSLDSVMQTRVNFNALDRPENPVRMRVRCTVVRVEHEREPEKSDFVRITYVRDGKVYRLKARTVVMASPQFINRHIIADLDSAHREAANHFYYAPHFSLNVAVRNWRFLHKLGISGARWFGGFGEWTEVRNPMVCGSDLKTFGPDSPVFLTLYVPLISPGLPVGEQCEKGRYELISTPYRDIERKMREQFAEMFSGSGFDPKRDIAGAILNRWGHAFIVGPPGFYFGKNGKPAPREVFRNQPFGRISFGHSDVNGDPSCPGAIEEGGRAAGQAIKTLA
jgi:spermidine dehydrogenase